MGLDALGMRIIRSKTKQHGNGITNFFLFMTANFFLLSIYSKHCRSKAHWSAQGSIVGMYQ